MPYFRILYNEETSEVSINQPRILVGREKAICDIVLQDPVVSRLHFLIAKLGDDYAVFDLHSSSGTVLNGQPITRANLKHGDNLEAGGVIMEFRTDNARAQASLVEFKDAEEALLLENFRMLPSGVKVRYRIVFLEPEKIFSIGDTLMVGQGGVLLPVIGLGEMPRDCLLDLELVWPNGTKKYVMGEIIARINALGAVCLKMHQIDRNKYDTLVGMAKRGNWVDTSVPRLEVEERLARRAHD